MVMGVYKHNTSNVHSLEKNNINTKIMQPYRFRYPAICNT